MFSKLIYQHTDTFRTTQAHKSCCQDGNYRVWKRAKSTHSGWRSRRHEGKPDWLWWAIRGIKSLQKVTGWRPARNHTQCPLCTRTLPAQFSSSKPALFQRLLWPSFPSAPEQAHRLTHVLGLSWRKIHHPQRADITDVFVQKSAVVQHHFCTNISGMSTFPVTQCKQGGGQTAQSSSLRGLQAHMQHITKWQGASKAHLI